MILHSHGDRKSGEVLLFTKLFWSFAALQHSPYKTTEVDGDLLQWVLKLCGGCK